MDRRSFHKLAGLAGLSVALGRESSMLWADENTPSDKKPWDRYYLGAAYYPEWWEEPEWETDFRQMQQLGINATRMGEFAWAIFEPAPGKFEFAWMDKAIDIARHYGVDVVLATPTASVPPWLYQLHPDVLTGNDAGL